MRTFFCFLCAVGCFFCSLIEHAHYFFSIALIKQGGNFLSQKEFGAKENFL